MHSQCLFKAPRSSDHTPHHGGGGHAARAIATRNAFRERDVSLLRNNVTSVSLDKPILESVSAPFPPLATPKAVPTQARRPPRLPRHRSPMPRADHASMRRRGLWIWRRRTMGLRGLRRNQLILSVFHQAPPPPCSQAGAAGLLEGASASPPGGNLDNLLPIFVRRLEYW